MSSEITANLTTTVEMVHLLEADVNTVWTLICAFMVYGMQIGFALVEAGSIMVNLRSIIMKNLLDSCICTMMWWFVGNGFAKGRWASNFVAIDYPFRLPESFLDWFFDVSFAATSATIVSGAMAERTKFVGYALFTMWISAVIYPFVVHWVWSDAGFMSAYNPTAALPLLDFAGGGVVHLVGGMASLAGAWLVGPRPGAFVTRIVMMNRKEQAVQDRLRATQLLFQCVGVMLLWIGWYGFNCGSVRGGIVGNRQLVGRVAVNTSIAAVLGGLVSTVATYVHHRLFKIDVVLMGVMSGLVSITASAAWVQTPLVVPISVIGVGWYYGLAWALPKFNIDDPVSAFPVHGGCGFWGLIAAGLFQDTSLSPSSKSFGVQLGIQIAGAIIIALWSLLVSLLGFLVLWLVLRGLRITNAEEEFCMLDDEYPRFGPQGHVTLVFTDIQSSTALWQADEEVMQESLILHDNLMRSTIKEFRGFEVKTEGDAFMVAFATALDAVKYCLAVQLRLLEVRWPKELYSNYLARVQDDSQGRVIWKGLRVRMGFHTGEPSCKENPVTTRTDYFGKDVNYAARVSSIGTGGQITVSGVSASELLKFYTEVDGEGPLESLPPFGLVEGRRYKLGELRCWLEYMGRYELKGISADTEGEHIFQVIPFRLDTRQFSVLQLTEEEEEGAMGDDPSPFEKLIDPHHYVSPHSTRRRSLCSQSSAVHSGRRHHPDPQPVSVRSGRLPLIDIASDVQPGLPHQNRLMSSVFSDTGSVHDDTQPVGIEITNARSVSRLPGSTSLEQLRSHLRITTT